MAWTTMHFATGMACSGAAGVIGAAIFRRGWRWIPLAMTVGGLWACVPDMPRLWRTDFPWLPFASTLGSMNLERWLHSIGDIFFFHKTLDAPPHKPYALHGLILMIFLYNVAVIAYILELRRSNRQRGVAGQQLSSTPTPSKPGTIHLISSDPSSLDDHRRAG